MPIVPATLVRSISFPGTESIYLYRFTTPSLPVSTISDDLEFTLYSPAKLEAVRISCSSKNYNFSLRLEPSITLPSIEEIYSVSGVSTSFFDDNIEGWYAKPVGPSQHKLYAIVQNVDTVNLTGLMTFEFVIKRY